MSEAMAVIVVGIAMFIVLIAVAVAVKSERKRAQRNEKREQEQAEHASHEQQEEHTLREQQEAREAERKRKEDLVRRATVRQQATHLERNFLDPAYREAYARVHCQQLLGDLKEEWFKDYQSVINDHDFLSLLHQEYPEVLEFLEARLETVRIAERLAVEPPPAPPPLPPAPKLTPEARQEKIERFRKRMVEKIDVKAQDFMAQQKRKLQLEQEYAAELSEYNISEDEFERLMQEFRNQLIELPETEAQNDGNYKKF